MVSVDEALNSSDHGIRQIGPIATPKYGTPGALAMAGWDVCLLMARSPTPRPMDLRARGQAYQLARRQYGVVGRGDLLESGLSSSTIGRFVRRGLLRRLHRGVYLWRQIVEEPEYVTASLSRVPTEAWRPR
ncbi:MAG: hypothetical protein EA422_04775 [Gemmatimonadales bacterium]|nr:MAG: hypothetical protein EA422_04775 [Gemmatimonadales bacterium]